MSAHFSVKEEIRHVFVTLKPAKVVKSEAEKSHGLLASPHRPKKTNVKLDNSYSIILTVPPHPTPPGFPHIDTAEKKQNAAFSVMKHKPLEHLLGKCNSQTPACDTESNSNTQDCVFFSTQKWE